jgi:hypothetical protein
MGCHGWPDLIAGGLSYPGFAILERRIASLQQMRIIAEMMRDEPNTFDRRAFRGKLF